MPRYRFTAVDSYGTAHDGTIDAATEDAARNKLASNGLAVRTVEEVAAAGTEPPPVPRRAVPKSSDDGSAVIPRRARSFEAADAPEARRGSPWPLILSLLALLVSVGTAVYTLTRRDSLANPLGKYDFRTPEAALESEVKIMASGNFAAQMQYQQRMLAKEFREKDNTIQVHRNRTRESRGKRVVFFEYDQNGVRHKAVAIMERDDDGMWKQAFPFTRNLDVDPDVQREINQWTAGRGAGGPGGWGGHGDERDE